MTVHLLIYETDQWAGDDYMHLSVSPGDPQPLCGRMPEDGSEIPEPARTRDFLPENILGYEPKRVECRVCLAVARRLAIDEQVARTCQRWERAA
jgi:hypothetical protein